MNKFVILALALFGAAAVNCSSSPYGQGPAIQQVRSLPNVPGLDRLLGPYGAGSAPVQVYTAPAQQAYGSAPSYAQPQQRYAPLRSIVLPSVPIRGQSYSSGPVQTISKPSLSYGPAPVQAYSAPSQGYSAPSQGYSAPSQGYAAPSQGYGAPSQGYSKVSWSVQPTYSTQLTHGPTEYKAYRSPASYSTVTLPVLPSAPVAKLYVPERERGYGAAPAPAY